MKFKENPDYETVKKTMVVRIPRESGMVYTNSVKLIGCEFNTDLQEVEMLIEFDCWQKK